MPPPAVSVDFRAPSDSNFNFNPQNGPSSGAATHPTSDCCSFNTGCSSSSSTSFAAGGRASIARTKPRLVKQRKSAKSSSSSSAAASVDSRINPFRSVSSQNSDIPNCSTNNSFVSQFENVGFVFGVPNSSNNNSKVNGNSYVAAEATTFGFSDSGNVDSGNRISNLRKQDFSFCEDASKRENNIAEGVAFSFGATTKDSIGVGNLKSHENGTNFRLVEELEKLNIEKGSSFAEENGHGLNNVNVLQGGDNFLVFKSSGGSSDMPVGSSVPLKSDANATNLNGNAEDFSDGKMDAFGTQCVEDVFVFGSSGKSSKPGDSCCQSPATQAEDDGATAKEDLLSSSFSFSSLDAEVRNANPDGFLSSGEKKVEFGSSGLPEESGVSFSEFKLPQFDASMSFSANLTSELGRKPDSNLRARGSKDRNSKKVKGKLKLSKHTKLKTVQNPVSGEGAIQSQEAPDCYSPMDFSPYEETASGSDVPLSGHHATYQIKVTNENLSALPTESRLNDSGTGFSSKMNNCGDTAQFAFSSDKASGDEQNFLFTSFTASQSHVSSQKRPQRRKYRLKPASVSGGSFGVQRSSLESDSLLSKLQGVGGNFSASASKDNHETKAGDELGCEASSAAEKACEKWRRRGNEAYEKGELCKAENFYTWGVNCVPPENASDVAFRPLARCYSNRAATRMALGRLREAVQDCLMAVKLDPSFHRAQIRAANCHLQLGEVEDAMQYFGKCMGSGNVCLDRQVIISASDGIQNSQKVIECTSRSAELLKLRTSEAAADALQYIAEAMSISINSEKLLELKAQALCILSRHEEAITLCQKTLDFAEKNFMAVTPGSLEADGSLNVRKWRYHTLSKCHFHLGNLEAALDFLSKQGSSKKTQETLEPLAVTIHELLKQKNAGNTAFHSGNHAEAVEHYTAAIFGSMESRPFAAICFCNRAAAQQALGQITEAISDCSLAIALDENYAKAVSRRATLHEMIRDYKQAACDLQRLLSLLQKQYAEKSKQSSSGNGKEIKQVQQRLSMVEEEAKKEIPLDLYLILGTKKSDTVSEMKKAYRKAALRHHPDKAAQSLVKSGEVGEEGRHWKDIADLVYKDSDRLFKMIGEAYAVLSDPAKREEYDYEEEMRKALKECNNIRTNSRRYSEHFNQGYPFERSSSRRYWQDSYRTYSHSHRRYP